MTAIAASPTRVGAGIDWHRVPPVAVVLAFAVALVALNPVGFIGGGGDEYQYLKAARCFADHGLCLPVDHWWRRWPIVLPAAVSLRLFGVNQIAIALVPLGYALTALALFTTLIRRQFGAVPAIVAGLILAATPMVSEMTLELNIDMPEFAFALAALLFLQRLARGGGAAAAIGCGLMLGLAIQARPTALALVPILGLAILGIGAWRRLPLVALTAALPSLVEAGVYRALAGDALLPWRLSLAHTKVPSTELLPGVDTSHSPLFNPDFIGGWRRPMDIHVHWTLDGLLNLVVHPAISVTLIAGCVLLLLERRRITRRTAEGGALIFVAVAAALWFGALTYGFAIDPKPRMFLPVAAAAATLFGVLGARRWPASRALIAAAFALVMVKGTIAQYDRMNLRGQTRLAPAWIAAEGPGLTIDPRTRRFLALVPAAQRLPEQVPGGVRGRMLIIGPGDCAGALAEGEWHGGRVRRSDVTMLAEPAPIPWLRAHQLFFSPPVTPAMCVIEG